MKKNIVFEATQRVAGVLAVLLAFAVVLAGCTVKGGSSGGSGGSAESSGGGIGQNPQGAAPATDFEYALSKVADGIVITGYTGRGGKVIIPAVIEDMPVVEIGDRVFAVFDDYLVPANNITEIVVPASVITIGFASFYGMGTLTSVTLPDNIKEIPSGCFCACKNMTTVNLPKSLEVIYNSAFEKCGNLTNMVIPSEISGVKFMFRLNGDRENTDNQAFLGCNKLPIKTRQVIQSWGYTGDLGL